MRNLMVSIFIIFMFFVSLTGASEPLIFDIPSLDNITIDGNASDWGDKGFRVAILTSESGEIPPASDLNAEFRLGWDDQGLLLLLSVNDDAAVESPDEGSLWQNDSVELFIAKKQGSPDYYQVVLSPGVDPKFPDMRKQITDNRADKSLGEELAINAARTKTEAGYILEASFPWKNLAIEAKEGVEAGFQLYVNDSDDLSERYQAIWYPRAGTHADPSAMHRIRLAANPSPAVLASASGKYEQMRRVRVYVSAVPEMVDERAKVREAGKSLASERLISENGRATASLAIPMPPPGKPYGELIVTIGNEPVATLNLPDPDEKRARSLIEETGFHFQPSVFSGAKFPSSEFEYPLWAEGLIGQYKIKTTYYDSEYNQVTSAVKPGRYGAVAEIIPEKGKTIRRFRTLFCQPEAVAWWNREVKASLELPKEMGVDPAVVNEQAGAISEYLKWRVVDGFNRDDSSAPLLAGLHETKPGSGENKAFNDVWAKDRQWWVGLKRKLYGMDKKFPEPFVCPRPIEGEPAPVLREGTPAEAGMKPDAVDNIDAVCNTWAADSNEGFAVCIARHGVIVLHKAYGQRDGRPMTVDDASWMASITKLLSGTLMMMLVDQGLVRLDDRVDTFLPAFEGIEVKTPLTIKHLYTHTNGLWGHWGDDLNDFDEVIADYYPYLKIGQAHSYNGAGYAIGGKVIEMVSGEAIPQFYKKHLLDPLGCTNTRVTDTSGGSFSIPLDIAKIGQMLLNKGKYGNMRFFSEETFAKMLPSKLTDVLGPEAKIEWGIGVTWFNDKGLGNGTFGHGAASSATLRIDPVNDLVIVMTRNTAGKDFNKYHPQFIEDIVNGLETSGK